MNRRRFLAALAGSLCTASTGSALFARAAAGVPAVGGPGPYGPLVGPDPNGLMLPAGFQSRVIAAGGQFVAGTSHLWHPLPDGGATFRMPAAPGLPSGYVYVSNSESIPGGVGAVRFDWRGGIVDAYSICSGTILNCAGGATPWGSWLTCEETSRGRVHECDPSGATSRVARDAMGRFKHEAVAADPFQRRFYLTEDEPDGLLYRFTPDVWGELSSGLLEVAFVDPLGNVDWNAVPDPNPGLFDTPTRQQLPGATRFDGGEGIAWTEGHVFFTTKGDNRVWDLALGTQTLSIFYDAALDPAGQLTGVDNATFSRAGDLLVAEDGGNLEIVLLTQDCVASPLVRITGQTGSEVTGPAFDPLGRRLYFSSQRDGQSSLGTTYEVEGPFRRVG